MLTNWTVQTGGAVCSDGLDICSIFSAHPDKQTCYYGGNIYIYQRLPRLKTHYYRRSRSGYTCTMLSRNALKDLRYKFMRLLGYLKISSTCGYKRAGEQEIVC